MSEFNNQQFNTDGIVTQGTFPVTDDLGYSIKYGQPYGQQVTESPQLYREKYTLYVYDYENNDMVMLKDGNIMNAETRHVFLNGEAFGIKNVRNINGYKELSFQIPYQIIEENELVDNFRIPYCTEEYKILLQYRDVSDYYIIKEVTDAYSNDGLKFREVTCWHYAFARLSQSGTQLDFEYIDTAENILTNVLNGSDWSVGVVDTFFEDDGVTEKIRTLKANGNTSRYQLIQEMAEIFKGFPIFNSDDKTINFVNDPRVDKGIVLRYGKNIKSYSLVSSTKELATKIWVEGGESNDIITYIDDVNPTGEPYLLNFGYFIEKGLMTPSQQTAVDDFENNISIINNDINTTLSSMSDLQSDLVNKEAELEFATTQRISKITTRTALTNQRNVTQDTTERATLLTQINNLTSEINALDSQISTLNSEIATIESDLNDLEDDYLGLIEDKNTELQILEDACGDFIREKLYKNENYTNAEALYNDVLKVSNLASYPQYEEKIDILDLSKLTGYEMEEFDEYTAVKIVIDPLGITSLGQIREIVQVFDDPRQNTATISTFITDFEDYMSNSFGSTNDLKIMKETYNRSRGLNPNGTVNSRFLQDALDAQSYVLNAQSQSYIDPVEGFISKDLDNPLRLTKLNSAGLAVSTDGGLTWELALTVDGLVGESIKVGNVDTKVVRIFNTDEPNFYIDSNGIWCYDTDKSNYVHLNKDGLECVKNGVRTVYIQSNGDATFAGSLSAATGTFAGSLTTNAIIAGTVGAGSLVVGGSSVNGEVLVKDANNVTKVKLNRTGITLADGTEIVGGNGVLSTLLFQSVGEFEGFSKVGWFNIGGNSDNFSTMFNVFIPSGFVIESAILYTKAISTYYSGTYYNATSIKLYKANSGTQGAIVYDGFDVYPYIGALAKTDISLEAWGVTTWSPTAGLNMQIRTSNDIKSQLTVGGRTTFIVGSTSSMPSPVVGSGVQMELVVLGYKK